MQSVIWTVDVHCIDYKKSNQVYCKRFVQIIKILYKIVNNMLQVYSFAEGTTIHKTY